MKKIILRILLGFAAILLILTGILAVHIYQVTRPSENTHVNWQLARVDFNTELDSAEATTIRSHFYSIPNIQQVYVNTKEGNVVYAYKPGTVNKEELKTALQSKTNLPFEFFEPDLGNADACPIINKKSVLYQIGLSFRKLFS